MPNRIREHRRAAGLSQLQLALLAGVGRATVQRAELGTHVPTAATLTALALALNVDPLALVNDPALVGAR